MTHIGLIDGARLRLVPKRFWAAHEYCFHLHDLMVTLLLNMEAQRADWVQVDIESEEERAALESGTSVLDFLATSGRGDLERRVVVNRVSMALYSDMLHFIHEALIAMEKRKFTVALTLLRKPFKEGLLMAAWACADEEDFFARLKDNPRESFDASSQTPETIIAKLQSALEKSKSDFVTGEILQSLIFDRKNQSGLAPLFDKATHLVTKNRQIATEDYNINFIFKSPADDDIYQTHYRHIGVVLLAMHHIQIVLYERMGFSSEKYIHWLRFVSTSAYSAIFSEKTRISRKINGLFADLMKCPSCTAKLRVDKKSAARFLIAETLTCKACQTTQHFPVGWLLSQFD